MDRCEICGRYPAKRMTFRAHQGFVLLRREIKYSGVFCRDCAIAVYAKARGVTLAGMWFSPGSLVMGTLGSLWDSAKLLDLPPEVKDEPWVPHKVACPSCRYGQFLSAGVADCEKCRSQYVVVSCERCGTVHAQAATTLLEEITVRCRECGIVSNAPAPARNAPLLLFPRALAEIASKVGATPVEFGQWSAAIGEHHRLQPASWSWLYDYYSECCQQAKLGEVLQNCIRFQQFQFLAFVLVVCRGFTTAEQYERLRALVRSLGLDPDTVFESDAKWESPTSSERDWHEVLGLEATASLEEVQLAYRRLARQFHPDLWQNAGADDQARDCQKMKELNGAYERAKKDLASAGAQRGTATQQADDGAERKRREHQAAAERDARAGAERQAREVAEREARAKAEREARENAERQTREQAERRARAEAERQARDEAERKARRQAEERTREKAEREARQAAERVANEAAERKAQEAFQSRTPEAAKPVADESNQAAAVPETPDVATVNLRAETPKARSESTSWNTGLTAFLLVVLVPTGVGALLFFSLVGNHRTREVSQSSVAPGPAPAGTPRSQPDVISTKSAPYSAREPQTSSNRTKPGNPIREAPSDATQPRANPPAAVSDLDAQVAKGKRALLAGDLDQAIAEFGQGLQTVPNSRRATALLAFCYGQRGRLKLGRGQLQDAVDDLVESVRLYPGVTPYKHYILVAYEECVRRSMDAGDIDRAIALFSAESTRSPGDREMKKLLASAYLQRCYRFQRSGDWNQAEADWDKARSVWPNLPPYSAFPVSLLSEP